MKSMFHLSTTTLFALILLILFSNPAHAAMARLDHVTFKQTRQQAIPANAVAKRKIKKAGLFKQIRWWMESKRVIKKRPFVEREKASTLAKIALYLFLGAIALNVLTAVAATSATIISAIISLAFLAAVVISFVILFSDENRRSKAIAKAILIVAGIAVLLTFFLVLAIIALLAA